jgi:hypothetical protein
LAFFAFFFNFFFARRFLPVQQYLADDLYKDLVLVINSAFPATNDQGGGQKASQGHD